MSLNLPNSVQTLTRPMLWLSLLMHGLLLMIPIATETEPKSSAQKKESVKITQLPKPSPQALPVATLPKPSPTVKQNPLPPKSPQAKTQPVKSNPIIESSIPSPIIQQNFATPTPTPIASATPTPVATPTPTPTPVATPTPTTTELAAGVPNIENAQKSCNGLCWQIPQTPFRKVSATLKEKFEAQGYAVEKQEIEDETGRSVYTISKDGKTQYLNVLSKDNGDAVYLVAERELTPEEITQKMTF